MSQISVDRLDTLLKRNAPYHLEEVAFIDCKFSGSVLENLLDVLSNAH